MTLLMLSRPRVVAGAEYTEVAASLIRFDGGSGSALVSHGLWFPPGLVPDEAALANVRVFLGSTEQSLYTEALRGRHNDGSLRGALIQFTPTSTPTSSAQSATYRIGDTAGRGTTDISKTTVTDAVAHARVYCLPTDAAYLCSTWMTFQPLVPVGSGNAQAQAFYDAELEEAYGEVIADGTAAYEGARGLLSHYCRTGNPAWFDRGLFYLRYGYFPNGMTPPGSLAQPHSVNFYQPDTSQTYYAFVNPEGLTSTNPTGGPNEVYGIRAFSFASGYIATGWGTYNRIVNHIAQRSPLRNSNRAAVIGTGIGTYLAQTPRANIGASSGAQWALASALIEATTPVTTGAGSGRQPNYTNDLPWILDCYELNTFSGPGYRAGVVGMNPNYDDGEAGFDVGEFPNFQLFLVADFLIDYWNNWQADARIPAMLKALADATIANSAALSSGNVGFGWPGVTHGQSYKMGNTALEDAPNAYYHGYMSRLFAWVYADTNDSAYLTWWERAAQPEIPDRDSKACKQWAEYFGTQQDAAYYLTVGHFVGPATPREPTQFAGGA